MRWKAILFLLIFCAPLLKASKIESAFEALSIYDYFKARKAFYELSGKRPRAAACYGLAIIYYRPDNPFHQPDSAAKYISLSRNYFKASPVKETYFGFTIDSLSIQAMADSIAMKNYERSLKINSSAGYEAYLSSNPASSIQRRQALYRRDEIMYRLNLSHNKSDSTRVFILRYPETYFLNDYLFLLDKQVFEEQTPNKSIEQYVSFIRRFPHNKFLLQAQDELFEIYKRNSTISELDFFVKSYPGSRSANEAWKLLYSLSVQSYSKDELQAFVQHYPEFPFRASINKEIELNNRLLIPVNDSDYTGFTDTSGIYRIPPVYEAATPFSEGYSVVERNDSVWFVNKENENTFGTVYQDAFPFTGGMAPVKLNGKWYLINRQAQVVTGAYEELSESSENAYICKKDGKYGAIDAYGNPLIQPQFDKMGDFRNGRAYYLSGGLYGFVDRRGIGSQPKYQWISDFDEDKIAIVKQDNQYGLIDQNDSAVLKPGFELIVKAKNQVYITVRNNKYGFYSAAGCFIADPDLDYKKELNADFYTNGRLFKLLKSSPGNAGAVKQALMDANGRISIDFGTYDEVNFAQNNLIRVKRKGRYGFVDRRLSLVIPCKYNSATDFEDSLSICTLKQETLIINTKGEEVLRTKGSIQKIAGFFLVKDDEGDRLLGRNAALLLRQVNSWQISPAGYLVVTLENKSRKVFRL